MRSFKKLGILVAVFALCAIGAANASAAEFTSTEEGPLDGIALETQVFTTSGGTVECDALDVTGNVNSLATTEQHVTVHYDECTAFGFPVHISPATYLFTTDGEVHLENTITIEVTVPIFADCHVTVAPQSLTTVDYANGEDGTIVVDPTVTGIVYTTSGSSFCGSSGSNGTYSGASKVTLTEGGDLTYDA